MRRQFSLMLALFLLMTSPILSQSNQVDFGSDQWTMVNAQIVEHLGRKSLKGIAYLKNVSFENGVIEVDIASTSGTRSYPGVLFRMQDMQNYERVYIRPHRSILYADAIQYAPSFNGIESWQLYNGEGRTSSADIPSDRWNHLRIEVRGSQAKVYWNDMEKPALFITDLAHTISKGMIGLHGPVDGSSYFSNFRYEKIIGVVSEEGAEPEGIVGILKNWEISQPLSLIETDFQVYPPDKQLGSLRWKGVESDDRGLVDISKYFGRNYRTGDCLYARTSIVADKESLAVLGFGYSDYITIFANGKPVYFGNSAYQSRDGSFLGIVGYFDNVFVPLKKGSNEIMVLVGESFGGWGFMFRNEKAMYVDRAVKLAWEIKNSINVPESVIYDTEKQVCYVSSYSNEGREYISKVSLTGEVVQKEWITGLSMPSGMCMHNNMLYVVDRKNLNVIDTKTSTTKERIPLTGMTFPNDVVTDGKGVFYISDSRSNAIFRYRNGSLESWLSSDEIKNPNGLFIDGEMLLVGVGKDGSLKKVSLRDKSISTIAALGQKANIDGIKKFDDSRYLVSDYNGRLFLISKQGEKQLLIDSRTPGQTLADFEYVQSQKRLIIPTLFDNRIVSYEVDLSN